jgi:hypothetical protein
MEAPMVWLIVTAIILLILAVLLFTPVQARAVLRRRLQWHVSVSWLGIKLYSKDSTDAPKPKKQRKPKKPIPWSKYLRLRTAKAGWAVWRTEGVRRLVISTARRAFNAIELERAHLFVTVGLGDPVIMGLVAGLMGAAEPRFDAWHGRVRVEFSPGFGGRWRAEGDAVLQTRLFPWLVIAVQVLCSPSFWRARRAWKAKMAPSSAPARTPR